MWVDFIYAWLSCTPLDLKKSSQSVVQFIHLLGECPFIKTMDPKQTKDATLLDSTNSAK